MGDRLGHESEGPELRTPDPQAELQGRDSATAARVFAQRPGDRPFTRGPGRGRVDSLRVVECSRGGCEQVLVLCRRCYRGQKYCGEKCRQLVRREQCRRAQARYLDRLSGRLRRAAAAAACRRRREDDGSSKVSARFVIDQPLQPSVAPAYSWPCLARCSRCGRPGRAYGPRRRA